MKKLPELNLEVKSRGAFIMSNWSLRGGAVAIHLKVDLDCFTSPLCGTSKLAFAMTVGGVFLSDSEGYSSGQLNSSASPQNDKSSLLRTTSVASFGMISSFFCGELENNYLDEKTGMEILVSYILLFILNTCNDEQTL